MTNKECIIAEIKRLLNEWRFLSSTEAKYRFEAYTELLEWIDSMPKEPVSKDLEEAAVEAFKQIVDADKNNFLEIFKAGAQWQKEQEIKYKHRTFLQGEKSVASYILKMIDNGWHINAIYTVCGDKLKED